MIAQRKEKRSRAVLSLKFGTWSLELFLHVISQHELQRVRIEIMLFLQVCLFVFINVMIEERNGHNKGYLAPVVSVDYLDELTFFVTAQILFKIAHYMMEDVGVLAGCGNEAQALHEGFDIKIIQAGPGSFCAGDKFSQF